MLAIVLLILIDIGLYFFINNVVLNVLNWFNELKIGYKILLLIIGGGSVFMLMLQIFGLISTFLGLLVFQSLPKNGFTLISTAVIAVANATWQIIIIWGVAPYFNFWIVCELLILSWFVLCLNATVVPGGNQFLMSGRINNSNQG